MNSRPEPASGSPWTVPVGSGGRLVVPAEARALLGIKPGDQVRMRFDGGNLVITTPAATLGWLRQVASGLGAMVTDPAAELSAQRRRDARRELEDG